MQIAPEHPETERERARSYVEERFFFNRITLDAAYVAPWDVELAVAHKPHTAYAVCALGNRALVPAGVAADPPFGYVLDEVGRRLSRALGKNFGQRGHPSMLHARRPVRPCRTPCGPLSYRLLAKSISGFPFSPPFSSWQA